MDNQDTNELLLDNPKEAKSPTKENYAKTNGSSILLDFISQINS